MEEKGRLCTFSPLIFYSESCNTTIQDIYSNILKFISLLSLFSLKKAMGCNNFSIEPCLSKLRVFFF